MKQEVAEALINWEDHEEADAYVDCTGEKVVGKSRWSTRYRQVYRRDTDDTYWEITWSRGSTEYQDNGSEGVSVRQVRAVQKTVTVYE